MSKVLKTKSYLKFTEFCNACKKYSYIGICDGSPGVGKTFSARCYTRWDMIEQIVPPYHLANPLPVEELDGCDSVFYTAPVTSSPARLEREIYESCSNLNWLINDVAPPKKSKKGVWDIQSNFTKLILIDEADRLTKSCLEQVRDIYDKTKIGFVLIGMPGFEKKLLRYAQLYSRVGFVYNFRPIENNEMEDILKHKWAELGLNYNNDTDREAFSQIVIITRGNFRLLQRLFTQIEFIMQVNNYYVLDKDVVETARENLMIGKV